LKGRPFEVAKERILLKCESDQHLAAEEVAAKFALELPYGAGQGGLGDVTLHSSAARVKFNVRATTRK
jgi:hypothetical protein